MNLGGYIRPDPKPNIMGWKKYAFEFLSIFVAVIAAFALDKWNSDRKDAQAEEKILLEISHGLQKDLEDIRLNMAGHRDGMNACIYWRKVLTGEQAPADSLLQYTFSLTRDFIAIQNSSGYESLRSRGLELVQDDSLRSDIISLYEYDLKILAKLEEDYGEMQLHASYYPAFSALIAPHLRFSPSGVPSGLDLPLDLDTLARDRFLLDLWKIQQNRAFTHHYYGAVEQRIRAVDAHIGRILAERS